jgi:hypothetical protein
MNQLFNPRTLPRIDVRPPAGIHLSPSPEIAVLPHPLFSVSLIFLPKIMSWAVKFLPKLAANLANR